MPFLTVIWAWVDQRSSIAWSPFGTIGKFDLWEGLCISFGEIHMGFFMFFGTYFAFFFIIFYFGSTFNSTIMLPDYSILQHAV